MSDTSQEKPQVETEATGEKMVFQAEVNQLLQLMIHSLYSNQEIFLRELISNSSDACDKLRFESIADASLLEDDSELNIEVRVDEEAKTVTIVDNGIGMNRDEVIANIGTIAKSGTKQFLESLTGDQKTDAKLIGQFGVGFYSAFVVADKVTLTTRKAGQPASSAIRWESDASGGYTLNEVEQSARGTTVTLHIKDDSNEFLSAHRLRNVIKKYSDHITFPIMMMGEVPFVPEPEEGEEPAAPEPAKLEQVNAASALWTRPKSEVTDEEYNSFYKAISNDFADPLTWAHNRVEGNQEYTSLLFLPSKAPFDLYDGNHERNGIKLFVQRVFIMDEAEKLMPRYLRFVRGLVDSNDLPLNVSREILQNNKIIDSIRSASVKRVLGMLERMADKEPEQYSPHLEVFRDKGIEVLLMHDRVDEWMMSYLHEYDGKSFVSIAKGDLDLSAIEGVEQDTEEERTEKEKKAAEVAPTIERIKGVLSESTSDVKASTRLTSSPACVVMGEHDMALHMQQLLKQAGHELPSTKPVLEVNPTHPILELMDKEQDDDRFNDWAHLLLDQALLADGGQLEDSAGFVKRMNDMFIALKS